MQVEKCVNGYIVIYSHGKKSISYDIKGVFEDMLHHFEGKRHDYHFGSYGKVDVSYTRPDDKIEGCAMESGNDPLSASNGFTIWKAEDIKPGRRYTKKHTEEIWLIGYRTDADNYEARYVSVSENDGLVTSPPHTKAELAEILNENNYVPVDIL